MAFHGYERRNSSAGKTIINVDLRLAMTEMMELNLGKGSYFLKLTFLPDFSC